MPNRRDELEQLDKATLIEGYLLLEKRLAPLEQLMADLSQQAAAANISDRILIPTGGEMITLN